MTISIKSIVLSSLAAGTLIANSAIAQDASITKAQQARAVKEITNFYGRLSADDRELALPLLVNIADNQLPYSDKERGVRLNSIRALPGQVLDVKMGFLADGPMASIDPEVAQTMLAPLAGKLACTDEMLRPILDLGIRIQLDIADARGQPLTKATMDKSVCTNPESLEETLEDLGVDEL